jgi:hypothetical protein
MKGMVTAGRRRRLDFYPTPGWAADVLWRRIPIRTESPRAWTQHSWAEPCVGAGDLIRPIAPPPFWTNDVDVDRNATFHRNAADAAEWETFPIVDWIVSNPPFNVANHVLRNALAFTRRHGRTGNGVAMLLRLSFLEPCGDRRGLLETDPPTRIVVLPRISFTGDRKTDSVTCAWMIWAANVEPGIEVVSAPKEAA